MFWYQGEKEHNLNIVDGPQYSPLSHERAMIDLDMGEFDVLIQIGGKGYKRARKVMNLIHVCLYESHMMNKVENIFQFIGDK